MSFSVPVAPPAFHTMTRVLLTVVVFEFFFKSSFVYLLTLKLLSRFGTKFLMSPITWNVDPKCCLSRLSKSSRKDRSSCCAPSALWT